MTDPARPSPVKSAMRTLDLIELVVAQPEGLPAREIGLALDIPMSSLSYLLATLCERTYLVRAGRLYRPGPGLDRLRLPEQALSVGERLAPLVRAVRQDLNETVSLIVRRGWEAEVVLTEASDHPLRYAIAVGELRPLHGLAAGKALLAGLGERDLAAYFAETARAALTPQTLTDEAVLRAEIARVRASGLAEAREESVAGICSMAFGVRLDGRLVGALSIAVPTVRFTDALRARFSAFRERVPA